MPGRYHVEVARSAVKSMAKIPLPWQGRIRAAIDALETEPYYGQKMRGQYAAKRKIRVWPYRIIYSIEEDIKLVKVFEVEHRGQTSYD